ncbi:HNH endonuclease signature motif containing protein [Arthrobacter zhaoguopingii]|uniref:HNH endonuclease signature motif containing protein n=1 Tax=Arthrobacter zhaoguopingii TaxID=2681491 RepID=UPI00135CF1F3|nr:HNH endonuclease signature motif containing protein [Arthrobacter zhaoguopingii]
MATAPVEEHTGTRELLSALHAELTEFAADFAAKFLLLGRHEIAETVARIEDLSKVVDQLQVLGAHAAEQHRLASGEGPWPGVAGPDGGDTRTEFRDTADYLRGRIGISRSEANRRLRLASSTQPRVPAGGQEAPAPLEILARAFDQGKVSGRAASLIRDAVERMRPAAQPSDLEAMEHHLTSQAMQSDEDILRTVARRWESVLDQDGDEPSEKLLRARQGVFLRGRRNGLHYLEIGATDEQFEHLVTVMNTATNPRLRGAAEGSTNGTPESSGNHHAMEDSGVEDPTEPDDPHCGSASARGERERPTRPQQLLDGLVGACRIALATDGLPAAGGHRPQVMVTIDYRTLTGELDHAGDAVFAQQIPARSIRRLACDADLIPLVLGGKGQVLDLGRAQRLFPPHLRRALVARDKGCAFPGCTIPATWCEAHHITPWEKGGTTTLGDGVLLCSHHHHRIHDGSWTVHSRHGIPFFLPPHHLDPEQRPRRNGYWSAGPPRGTAGLHLE